MQKIRMTLSKKIVLLYICCVFLPVLLLAIFFTVKIDNIFQERTRDDLKNSVEKAAGNIARTIESAENIAVSASIDETLVEILQKEYGSYDEFYQSYNGPITSFLEEITTAAQGMSEIVVYTENPTIYNSSVYRKMDEYPQINVWLNEMGQENTEVVSWVRYKDDIEASGIRQPAVAVLYRIPIYNPEYQYGMVIQVFVSMDRICYWLQDTNEAVRYYLINDKDQVVSSTGQEYEPYDMINFTQSDRIVDEEGVITYTSEMEGTLEGWTLLGVIEADTMMEDVSRITLQTGILLVLILLISAIVTILLIRPYTSRLRILSNRMAVFDETDFSPIRTKQSNDEVEIVIQSFNRMMEQMNVLINEVYALNMQKKELELEEMRARMNVLISQVNPHFLFNTLNAILAISERNHYEEVSWTIEHLAIMMRKLLDWSDDMVTVREETEFIRMYLDIEKLRFSERFDFAIEVDPEMETFRIPKMSVQPLVENACKHGIHKISGYGQIRVCVRKEEGFVTITVVNTGSCLTQEQVQVLRESIFQKKREEGKGVGLQNVYRRILLYYKENAEIIIESHDNETCFGFRIRLEAENNDTDDIS